MTRTNIRGGQITDATVTDADVDGTVEIVSRRGVANGYPSLDSSALVPTGQLGGSGADATKFLRGDRTWVVPPPPPSDIVFKKTDRRHNGDYTTTSITQTPIDATNLAYLTLTLAVGDVVRCTLACSAFDNSGNGMTLDFEVDQPTSANTYVGGGSGVVALSSNTAWTPVTAVGLFVCAEAGSHGFRPTYRSAVGTTVTVFNQASGAKEVPVLFVVEKLGAPTS